jgi:Ser/Thr protein kinase RdoA (MazF antagonist)
MRRLNRLGRAVLDRYQIQADQLIFVQRKNHAIFRVIDPHGRQFVLRIHPPDRYSPAIIEDELHWLQSLCQATDIVVSEPLVANDGALVTTLAGAGVPEAQHCVVFRWLPGRIRQPRHLHPRILEQVGTFVARLHHHATQFALPINSRRRPWDGERLVGTPALLSDICASLDLTQRDKELLKGVAAQVHTVLTALGRDTTAWGMIHADFHPWNMLWHQGRVAAIDFDDCGEGHYLFDLAVALFNWTDGGADRCRYDAILTGYARVRSLPAQSEQALRILMAARCYERTITSWMNPTTCSMPQLQVIEMLTRLRRIVEG